MNRIKYLSVFIVTSMLGFIACEDVVDVDTDPAVEELVVDAWINNRSETQVIRLTGSSPYFETRFGEGITEAKVTLTQNSSGRQLDFLDQGDGNYFWSPAPGDSLGTPGISWQLDIDKDSEHYQAITTIFRTSHIDSVTWEFRDDEIGGPDGIYAQFFARDPLGIGDAYWIKAFKNGQFLNKPQEINLAFDAGFDAGSEVDGIIFITPIREFINPVPDPDTNEEDEPPYVAGDEIRVEIHSLSPEAHTFMSLARDQMINGDNTIFATPLANTRSNVLNTKTSKPALGYFNIAAISIKEVVVTE